MDSVSANGWWGDWLIPQLSLPTQLEMEMDRRAAAQMSRDELAIKVDQLVIAWYQQQDVISRALGEVRQLQVKLAIAEAPTRVSQPPSAEHYRWAQELQQSI